MTILDQAREHLRGVAQARQGTNDPQARLFESLYDVSDHTCRVADHADDHFYAAEKAGVLVTAAIHTKCEAMRLVNNDRDQGDDESDGALLALGELLRSVHTALAQRGWQIAQNRPPTFRDLSDWRQAGEAYQRWLATMEPLAVPDEDYG